jgi:rhodanese-related sulfurtransferase
MDESLGCRSGKSENLRMIHRKVMFPNLQGKVKSISATEAAEKVKKGKHVLVDVRTKEAFEQAHPEGAVNVPLYKTLNLQEGGPSKWLKYLAYAANGVSPIELNTAFDEEIKAAAAGKGIITICDAGGSLKPTVNFPQGKASRSLQAAYIALTQGLTSGEIIHLDRGLYGWYQEDGEMVGEYKPDIGRTPMAAQDPTLARLSAETGYEVRPGDKR